MAFQRAFIACSNAATMSVEFAVFGNDGVSTNGGAIPCTEAVKTTTGMCACRDDTFQRKKSSPPITGIIMSRRITLA